MDVSESADHSADVVNRATAVIFSDLCLNPSKFYLLSPETF